jgi:transmembrane sensor
MNSAFPSDKPRPGRPSADSPDPLDWPADTGEAERVLADLDAWMRRRRRRRLQWLGGAAAMAALLFFAGREWSLLHRAPPATRTASGVTVQAPEKRVLPDGTSVELRAGAEMVVDFQPGIRRIALLRGEAHFAVTKDPQRPFIVEIKGVKVRAIGTAFSVSIGETTVVLVTEGRVAVERSALDTASPLATLGGGSLAVVGAAPDGRETAEVRVASESEIEQRLAWRLPRLSFAATPLREVVALFNHHNPAVRLEVGSRDIEALELSGTLRANDVASLARILERQFSIRIEQHGEVVRFVR